MALLLPGFLGPVLGIPHDVLLVLAEEDQQLGQQRPVVSTHQR